MQCELYGIEYPRFQVLSNPPVSAPLIPVSRRLHILSSDQDKDASAGLLLGPATRVLLRCVYCLHDKFDTKTGLIAYSRMAGGVPRSSVLPKPGGDSTH